MTKERWEQSSVGQLMTPKPVTVGSGTELGAAAQMLLKHAVSALPVVDNGDLVGILSEKDFVRHFAKPAAKS
jgi:CBS domain-containing protein